MSATELLQRLQANSPDNPIDWRAIREEIHNEHDQATTAQERVMLLSIFTVIMDQVERSGLSGEDLAKFKVARRQDYNLLLVKESLVGENVCTETLSAVTEREVAAGRMAPDDELRTTAEVGMAAPHLTRAQLIGIEEERQRVKSPSSSWAQKLIRVFKK